MSKDTASFYFIKPSSKPTFDADLRVIMSQIGTYDTDEIKVKHEQQEITISYPLVNMTATLKPEPEKKFDDVILPPRIVLKCHKYDNLSINLLRGIVGGLGYRVYNPDLEAYTPTDPNFIDLSTSEIDKQLRLIFKQRQLTPYFQYRNSAIYIAQSRQDYSIHLVNRHLLNDAIEKNKDLKDSKGFSIKIAKDFITFVALSDRGLIPRNFYTALHQKGRPVLHINHSGFSLESLESDIYISPIFFELDRNQQQFHQFGGRNGSQSPKIVKRGTSLRKHISNLVKEKNIGKLVAVKYPLDIEFQYLKNEAIPRLNISIFLEVGNTNIS